MKQYYPLVVLVLVSALAGLAITIGAGGDAIYWMHGFMGVLLVIFALLKLFNPTQFAEGFAKYDIFAKNSHGYALVYPFIELALGIGYLSHVNPRLIYTMTLVIFALSAVGVLSALKKGLNVNCACMGTVLKVPLSSVTLTEDIAMITMSAYMLVHHL